MLGIRTPEETTAHLGRLANQRSESGVVEIFEEPVFTSRLASRIDKSWSKAKSNKTQVERNMLECLRERKGEYGPEERAAIKEAGGSDIYIKLATSKIRAGIAHVKSILIPEGDRAHGIEPTKNPSLPDWINDIILERILQNPNMVDANGNPVNPDDQLEILQTMARREISATSKRRARGMDRKITDQLQEGGYIEAMAQYCDDFCTYPAAFMNGPYFANVPRLSYEHSPQGFKPTVTYETVMKFSCVNPFDAYPAPGSDSVQKGDFIERVRLSRNDVYMMKGMPGYNDKAIDEVLTDHRAMKLQDWLWTDAARSTIAEHNHHWQQSTTELDGLHWYGKAQGYELVEWGMDAKLIPDMLMEYEIDAIKIGRHVIKAVMNTDPLHRRPIHSTCYEKIPGSVFGNSPSMLMRSTQRMVNATGRALQNNLAHASGFQAEVDYTRISSETDVFDLHPFKVWQARESEFAGDRPAVRFFQPDSNAPELINVMDYFKTMADNDTGIPEFLHGGTGGNTGADATAKGRSMLLDQSAKLLLSSIMNIDRDICIPKIRMMYDHNMRFDPDEDIKGDCQVVPKGINARLQQDAARQAHMALLEVTGADPQDRAIVGMEGRAKMIKSLIGTFDEIDTDEIIPSDEELEKRIQDLQNQKPPPDPALLKVQADQESNAAKLELERERLTTEQRFKDEGLRADRMLKMMELRSKERISSEALERSLQDEMVKLKATRMSERERLQIDVAKEKMKAEGMARLKIAEMKMQMDLQKQQLTAQASDSVLSSSESALDVNDIRAVVESVVAPMISTFQNDTMKVMDAITNQMNAEQGASSDPRNLHVNVDTGRPTRPTKITTSRDEKGNLQAMIEPVDAEVVTSESAA